jgi:hypothetical protein
MTSAYSPTAPGAVGTAKRTSVRRINALPIAVLALAGTATLAIANFGFGNSPERTLSERLDALSAQVNSLEQAVQTSEPKVGPPEALRALEVKQVQTDALVATLAKDVETLRSPRKVTAPSPAKNRAKAKAAH